MPATSLAHTAFTVTQKVKPMTKPIVFDGEQHREMTDAELAQWELDNANTEKERKASAKAETDKATAKQAVLDRLGITADEAALLLG